MITNQDLVFLESLGFSSLEIEIYQFLLNNEPATGYTISRETGRYKANVYNALASLVKKGAILVSGDEGKIYKAVMPNNLINQMKVQFDELVANATKLEQKLKVSTIDERIYQLSSVKQVFETYRTILKNCQEIALIELYPEPLQVLKKDVEAASSRGINITLRKYSEDKIDVQNIIQSPYGTDTFKEHKGSWLSIFADGTQFLIAHLTPDHEKVRYAFWSQNPFLSWTFYSYISRDFLYYSLRPLIESSNNLEEVQRTLNSLESQFPIGKEPGSINLTNFFNTKIS